MLVSLVATAPPLMSPPFQPRLITSLLEIGLLLSLSSDCFLHPELTNLLVINGNAN